MVDLAKALALRLLIQALALAAVVTHRGGLLIVLVLAVFVGTGVAWAAAVEAVHEPEFPRP
ncbi:hypothetical protein [Azospirillum palustre]